jgi:Flp pilus assembly pilin Flp
MRNFLNDMLCRIQRNEEGTTAVEYAIMLALVALGVALAAPNIKQAVVTVFTNTITALQSL